MTTDYYGCQAVTGYLWGRRHGNFQYIPEVCEQPVEENSDFCELHEGRDR